jgi:NADH:ubiquinone oxidoreductase subunit F (NADH-binding)/(2Fe-2S) ferredoxin/NAD-dependent dihydropyrimidine dehydrogenase PreA subunit
MLTLESLNELRRKTLADSGLGGDRRETRVTVGLATCGIAAGAGPVLETLKAETAGIEGVGVYRTGCIGVCRLEPLVEVYEPGRPKVTYVRVTPEKAKEIAAKHIKGQVRADEYTEELDFTGQLRIALRNCGLIDPENIEEYIARDGYQALAKTLNSMKPLDVVETLKKSGLRGRGGAGFPTGLKWQFAAQNDSDQKYVCCNADEGDPGAFMDRSVLEGDPHAVLEAMAIAGYAIGSAKGFIYIRAEYPVAVKRLGIAIDQAKTLGVLGDNIFGSGFSFDIELRLGAGAFVCGEETALMTSIEGKRGEPRPRPPFPAVKGLWQKPTILNNVETFANVAQIILNGADWFAGIGTERSKGTKVFALGGKINNTGLIEVPMGTPLRFIIEQIGGGIPGGRAFKAAQTGGPSGGCIPAAKIDTPIEYETLLELGSMMGSGGLIVIDEDNCMVDVARFFLDFTVDESCGKCPPCRIGTKRMLELLGKITSGQGEDSDIEKLEQLAVLIKSAALCGLGQTAPNPVLSTLRYFRHEYEEHIRDGFCAAAVCKALIYYEIDTEKCNRCNLCKRNCPSEAITGGKTEDYVIDRAACIKCGLCVSKCRAGAIGKKNR